MQIQDLSVFIEKFSYVLIPLALLESIYLSKSHRITLKESFSNIGNYLLGKIIKRGLLGSYLYAVLHYFEQYAYFDIPNSLSMLPLAVLVSDFTYYWKHRLSHTIRLMWSYHNVHHSSTEFNLTTALRLPWFGIFTDGLFYIPAVLLGFDPIQLIISKSIILMMQYPIHTETVGRLPLIDYILNSPSNHRVHHGSNPIYIDKNHGGIFMIWDQLFGTYQRETEPVVYGITKPLNTYNPFTINLIEPYRMIKDALSAKGIKNKLMYIFAHPAWKPKN